MAGLTRRRDFWDVPNFFDNTHKENGMEFTIEMKNYIAHPFWPARNRVIEIEKKSGVNRQKSEEKRAAAIKAECERQGFTIEDYARFKGEAAEQWYRWPQERGATIIIPRHQIAGGIVQAIGSAPKALRGPFDRDNFRALVQIGDFATDRNESSGTFGRFVKLEGSNQRSWQENEYIGEYLDVGHPFSAKGVISCEEKHDEIVKRLFTAVLELIGIGAARKMGFGRGRICSCR